MYQSNPGGARHLVGAGLAVGALQLGIGIVLLSTFAGGAITTAIHNQLQAHKWTYVPPPPPRHPANAMPATHRDSTVPAPRPTIPGLVIMNPFPTGPIATLPQTGGDDIGQLIDMPLPHPKPALPSIAAHPLGDPGAWIIPEDYPWRALREGWRGVTRVHLVIDSDGRVTSCTVTASSGHDALDAVACAKVAQRARFSPARDGTGAAHEGAYDNAIHWEIHEETN
jgi:protein TonB